MPRDGSGIYHRPVGTDAVTDTTIESTKYNINIADVEQDLNQPRPLVAGGTGASSATQALFNLSGETAANIVTNWDSEVWTPGSFYAATSATGAAPVAGHAFAGICYINEALANPPTNQNLVLEATDLTNPAYPIKYIRVMTAGVWSAWTQLGGTPAAGTLGEYIFNSSITFPPASGEIRFNNATQNSTTELFISHLTATSIDITSLIATLLVPGFDIIIQDKITPTSYKVFTATGSLVTSSSDFRILVTFKSGGTNLVSTNRMLVSAPGNSTVRYDAPQNLTAPQQTQARQNIYAAPFDAMAYSGMQINGSMDVSQEKGSTATTVNNQYICDGWLLGVTGTMVASAQRAGPVGTFTGLPYLVSIGITTAQTSLGASDLTNVFSKIEGWRISRLAWGTANAQPITIGFWTAHHRTGTYCVSVRSSNADRSYVVTYTQNVADAAEYKTVTVPGCIDGTWNADNTIGMYINFSMACGTTYQGASANTWLTTNSLIVAGQVNAVAATSDVFRLTGVVVLPGSEAPSVARSALIMRPYVEELRTCKRYYEKLTGTLANAQCYSTTAAVASFFYSEKRVAPTLLISTLTGMVLNNAASSGLAVTNVSTLIANTTAGGQATVNVASGLVAGNATIFWSNAANAFLGFDARL